MDLKVTILKNRVLVESPYNQEMVAFFQTVPKRFWNSKKWSFPRDKLDQLLDFFKSKKYNVTIEDKSIPVLVLQYGDIMYIKGEVDAQDFMTKFPNAEYDISDKSWKIDRKEYSRLSECLENFIYISQDARHYLPFLNKKLCQKNFS